MRRIKNTSPWSGILCGLSLLTLGLGTADAGAIATKDMIYSTGSTYEWNYQMPVTGGQVKSGDYVILYDFDGFNGVHSEPEGWTFVGEGASNPPAYLTPYDDPNITNLVWTRTAGDVPAGTELGTFTAGTTIGGEGNADFASVITSDGGPPLMTAGVYIAPDRNAAPDPGILPKPVPEPGMLAIGLVLGAAGFGWRRRKTMAVAA